MPIPMSWYDPSQFIIVIIDSLISRWFVRYLWWPPYRSQTQALALFPLRPLSLLYSLFWYPARLAYRLVLFSHRISALALARFCLGHVVYCNRDESVAISHALHAKEIH